MARTSQPFHLIRYGAPARETLDYVIAFQCGFLMRLVGVEPKNRYEVGSTPEGEAEIAALVAEHLTDTGLTRISKARQHELSAQLLGGLITQLRSIPLALRIDHWLRNEYPGLKQQQDASWLHQLDEGVAALNPRIRRAAPKRISEASIRMNAAQAAYWAEQWEDEEVVVPYKAVGVLESGRELLQLWREIPGDPIHDPELISAWARKLGIQKWYAIVPFGAAGGEGCAAGEEG